MVLVEPSRLRDSWWSPLRARIGVPAELDGFPLGGGYVCWDRAARSEVISLPYDEVNMVLKGRLEVEVPGASVTAEAGQMVLLERGCYRFNASDWTMVCSVVNPPDRMPSVVEGPDADWRMPRTVDPSALGYRSLDGDGEAELLSADVDVPMGFSIRPILLRFRGGSSPVEVGGPAALSGPHALLTVMSGSVDLGGADGRVSRGQTAVVEGAGPLRITGVPGTLACVHRVRPSPAA